MKQTQIQLGGWEALADDIQYIQDGAKEALEAVVKGMMHDSFINGFRLWGLEMTLSNANLTLTWTAGAVAFDGEIFQVDAGTANRATTSNTWRFMAVDSWGQSNYTGPGLLDTRNDRKATLIAQNNVFPITYTQYDVPFLVDVVNPKFRDFNISGTSIKAMLNPSTPVAGTLQPNAAYKIRRANNTVEMSSELVYILSGDADWIDIRLLGTGAGVSAGTFVGVAMVNGKAHRISIYEDDDSVRLRNYASEQFAAGVLLISFSMQLDVK